MRLLPKQLVQLRTDEEDRRRDEDVPREEEQDGQAADGTLEVRDRRHPELEQKRRDDPDRDNEERACARPSLLGTFGRRKAHHRSDDKRKQRATDEPAAHAEQEVEDAALNTGRNGEDQEAADEANSSRDRERECSQNTTNERPLL